MRRGARPILVAEEATGTVFEQTTFQSVLATVGQIAIGWTALSVLAASAWSLHRAPGRVVRLALEERAMVAATTSVEAAHYFDVRSAA